MSDQDAGVEPTELPPLPGGVSGLDTLPESFVQLLSRRPHMLGDVIAGRYRLEEKLGDGAMGQVFAAVNLAIKRRVAIKVLKPDLLADAQFRKRFQQEAEAIARIEHRNVAHFIDLVVGDPTFLVMEYVAGPTLGAILRKQSKLEPRRAIAIATRLCWALEAAHQAGVIHRDVKPGNVILAPDPELGEEPKLIDFGLAKIAATRLEDTPTRAGEIVGTPRYMAPEQIANKTVDRRADVYGLGCVLYHMVAGRPPFEGETDVQLMYQHMESPPEPLDRVAPDVPAGLQTIVERALAKDPDARFQTMRELAKALGALERRQHGAVPVGERRSGGGRVLLFVSVALVVAGLAGGAGWLASRRGAPAPIAGAALLVVDTTPPGARLTLDGKAQATATPAVLSQLAAGHHVLGIELAGRAPLERAVELAAGERRVLSLQLPGQHHKLQIESSPDGATVFLDRQLAGVTPLAVDVSDEDFHELRLEKPGFETVQRGLAPDQPEPMLTFTLQPETREGAKLEVTADSAQPVFLDGKDTGFVAPTIPLETTPGPHVVELRDLDGRVLATQKITCTRGEIRRVHLAPGAKK